MGLVQTDSASGSFVNSAGQTVTYTTTSSTGNLDSMSFAGLDGPTPGYEAGNQSVSETHTRTFSEEISGAQIKFVSFSHNASAHETVTILLDGVAVNLNDLIASGQAILTSVQNDVVVNEAGALEAVLGENISSIATLSIRVPFTSIALELDMVGSGMGVVTEFYASDRVPPVVCFCSGTLITAKSGQVPVERLKVGDRVQTLDNGLAELKWTGNREFGSDALMADPKLRPVRIRVGALGQGLPKRDMWVSRQHRILLASRVAERMFGTSQILVPAIKLVGMPGIEVDFDIEHVAYHHLAFDHHQIIFAEEAPTESLLFGHEAMKSMPWAAQVELKKVFPELLKPNFNPTAVRGIPHQRKTKQLIHRHMKNSRPILDSAIRMHA